jgi:hypothetical protein
VDLPFAHGVDPDSGSNALIKAMELSQKKKQDAASNLMAQQRLGMDQQRMQAENTRADAAGRREDRLLEQQQRQQRMQGASAVLPYLDPNSPQFNPQIAQQMAGVVGVGLSQTGGNEPAPQAPAAPQPGMEGPIPSAHDAMMGALGGTRTDNPNHEGQVFVDQAENGSAHLVPPEGGAGAFNFPASQLGARAQESTWVPDPRRGRAYVDQVDNGSAHLLGAGGGDAFNVDTGSLPRMPKESQWIRDPRGPADPLPIQTKAAQEAMQQQAERDQYAQQLAEAPQRQAQYHQQIQDYQQRKQFPAFQMDMGDGKPITIDTMAIHRQAEGAKYARVEAYKEAYAGNPDALKIAIPMASLGVPDDKIAAAVNSVLGKQSALTEKGREADQTNATRRYGIDARKGHGGGGAGGLAPGGKAWTKEEGELANELKTYEQRSGLTGPKSIAEGQRELESALREAESNPNGTTQLRIMDKMIRSATGLGVRNQTLQTYMKHMGGLMAQGEGQVEQWANGKLGQEQWHNVVESMRSQLAELQAQGGKANEDFKRTVGSNPSFARHKDLVQRREAEMFGGLHGYGDSNPLTDAAKMNARNQKIQQMSPEDKAAVDWADKHPNDPRSPKIRALHGL